MRECAPGSAELVSATLHASREPLFFRSGKGQKRPEQARGGQNSRETTAKASKRKGSRAKPQRERRNATEFSRNHSGSVETKVAPHRRVRRCGPQPILLLTANVRTPSCNTVWGKNSHNSDSFLWGCRVGIRRSHSDKPGEAYGSEV